MDPLSVILFFCLVLKCIERTKEVYEQWVGVKIQICLLLGALGDLEDIRVDTESSDGSTGAGTLDDQGAGEALGGECDDVVAALQRGEGVAGRVSISMCHQRMRRRKV